jgi:hypothetical protein
MYPDKHEQAGCPFITLHVENGPQGDGWQGSWGGLGVFTSSRMQPLKGLPTNPLGQVQIGLWL